MWKMQQQTTRMMEGGLNRFHGSIGKHMKKIRKQKWFNENEECEALPITSKLMRAVFIFSITKIGLAFIILFIQIMKFRFKSVGQTQRVAKIQSNFRCRRNSI